VADFSHWRASLTEHRTAWIIACCCIAAILLAATWPGLFNFKSASPVSESRQADSRPPARQQTRFTTPEKQTSRVKKKQPQSKPPAQGWRF